PGRDRPERRSPRGDRARGAGALERDREPARGAVKGGRRPRGGVTSAPMIEIVMNGPAKNALGSEMMTWLIARLREANGAPVLLTGTGDAFSAGLNLKEVAELETEGMAQFLRLLETCMSAL